MTPTQEDHVDQRGAMLARIQLVVLLAALIPTLAKAESVYRITDLGDLPGGADSSEAADLNNNGEVVGSSRSTDVNAHAFLWTSSSGMQDLGVFFAAGINDSTQIAGSAVFGAMHAALWDAIDGIQDLGDLPGGDNFSNGRDINNSRQVVGFSSRSGFVDHAFIWDDTHGMQDLGSLVGSSAFSSATAINNLGQVVGESAAATGGSHAFLWDSADGMQDLGKLPGGANDTSRADDINDAGQVVGFSAVTEFGEHAFIWDRVNGMRDLGVLPGGENWSFALSINNSGQIVGVSGTPSGPRAVLWTDGSITDLNEAVDPSDPLAPYVTLTGAQAINDGGQIAATGTDSRTGATHAYLLTLVAFLDLASLPDVNGNGAADAAVLVAAIGSQVHVRDGATGDPISQMTILDGSWRAIDLAVTPGGAGTLIAVLAQKNDGLISVAVHRARDGQFIREIPFFGPRWLPFALVYVPNATGAGGSAFGVVAKNIDDERMSVQLRTRSDGSLINTNRFFLSGWDAIGLDMIGDVSGNNRPEIVVLGRSGLGLNQVVVKDAATKALINKINYFGAGTIPSAIATTGDSGGGAAPELAVLGKLPDGRHVVQNRDVLTDERVNNVTFFNSGWSTVAMESVDDVNGNGSAELAVLAQHDANHAIRVQVRDAFTDDLIRTVGFLGPSWDARAFAVFEDIDGNGVQELGVMAVRNDGSIRVQLRDASSGSTIGTMSIP